MKNIFSVEVKTGEQPHNNYIIKKTDSAVSEKEENALKSLYAFQKKYSLPIYFKVIMYICGFVAAMVIFGVISALVDGGSLSKGYHNAPWLFYIGGGCLLIFLILYGIARYMERKGQKDPELQTIAEDVNTAVKNSLEDLGVPVEAGEISVFSYLIKIKKGKEKPALPLMRYSLTEMKIYADTEKLYLADIDCVTAIPFSDIQKIVANKRRTEFQNWTKDEPYKSPKYKPYKVRAYQYGFTAKTYSMQILSGGEVKEILIPNFEIEALKTYVAAPVIELSKK